jgi:hypothetical protein
VIAAAVKPVTTPRMKYLQARFFFLRITADAMNPHNAATPATAANRISCSGPAAVMWASNHRRRSAG